MARTKYNVSKDPAKRTYAGITFASELEMRYYRDVIRPGIASGQIAYCEMQKAYELQPAFRHDGKTVKAVTYVADFVVKYADGRLEVIDTKGYPDNTALLKRKLFWFKYPDITYRWICFSRIDGGWCDYEYVKKCRAERKKAKTK